MKASIFHTNVKRKNKSYFMDVSLCAGVQSFRFGGMFFAPQRPCFNIDHIKLCSHSFEHAIDINGVDILTLLMAATVSVLTIS